MILVTSWLRTTMAIPFPVASVFKSFASSAMTENFRRFGAFFPALVEIRVSSVAGGNDVVNNVVILSMTSKVVPGLTKDMVVSRTSAIRCARVGHVIVVNKVLMSSSKIPESDSNNLLIGGTPLESRTLS